MNNLNDKEEIKNKMGLYTFAWDECKPEEFPKMFTEVMVFEAWTPNKQVLMFKFGSLQELIEGRKRIGGYFPSETVIRHNLSNVTFVEITDTTAETKTVFTSATFFQPKLDAPTVWISGVFYDNWVKTNNGWLIKNRVMIYDNAPPTMLKTKM
ncbi:MAG: nuclear transport factor 2 family protein [Promethearchaeia archaeon]